MRIEQVRRAWCPYGSKGKTMNLPTIDISALPDLDNLTGVFGSFVHPVQAASSDDTIVLLMAFLYEVLK